MENFIIPRPRGMVTPVIPGTGLTTRVHPRGGNGNFIDTGGLEGPASAFHSLNLDVIWRSQPSQSHMSPWPQGLGSAALTPSFPSLWHWPRLLELLNNNGRIRRCHLVWIQDVIDRSIVFFFSKTSLQVLRFEDPRLQHDIAGAIPAQLHMHQLLLYFVLGPGSKRRLRVSRWPEAHRPTLSKCVRSGVRGWIWRHADGWAHCCSVSHVLPTYGLSPGHHVGNALLSLKVRKCAYCASPLLILA